MVQVYKIFFRNQDLTFRLFGGKGTPSFRNKIAEMCYLYRRTGQMQNQTKRYQKPKPKTKNRHLLPAPPQPPSALALLIATPHPHAFLLLLRRQRRNVHNAPGMAHHNTPPYYRNSRKPRQSPGNHPRHMHNAPGSKHKERHHITVTPEKPLRPSLAWKSHPRHAHIAPDRQQK